MLRSTRRSSIVQTLLKLSVLLIVLTVLPATDAFGAKHQDSDNSHGNDPVALATTEQEPVSQTSMLVYQNSVLGYEFEYPEAWTLLESRSMGYPYVKLLNPLALQHPVGATELSQGALVEISAEQYSVNVPPNEYLANFASLQYDDQGVPQPISIAESHSNVWGTQGPHLVSTSLGIVQDTHGVVIDYPESSLLIWIRMTIFDVTPDQMMENHHAFDMILQSLDLAPPPVMPVPNYLPSSDRASALDMPPVPDIVEEKFLTLPFFQHPDMHVQQGWYYHPGGGLHAGIDLIKGEIDNSPTWMNYEVVAGFDGEACGNCASGPAGSQSVWIKHVVNGAIYYSYYGHLAQIEPSIPLGSLTNTVHVQRGQRIGISGDTGTTAGWIHLHFLTKNASNMALDPYDLYSIDHTLYYPGGASYNGMGPNHLFTADPPSYPGTLSAAVDVYLLVDLTGSFYDDLPVFKAQAPSVIAQLQAEYPNTRFGLGKFEDYPIYPFGNPSAGDEAYERLVDLTSDTSTVLSTINGLVTRDGYDTPESQLPALYQAATGAGQDLSGLGYPEASIPANQQANFRDGATKIFLLWTDAEFHQPGDPGNIPYPGPSFAETVSAILALDPPKVIGISSGGGGVPDLQAMATATDALAPVGGVDCDDDGVIDLEEGEPMVCSISSTGSGIAEAIVGLVQATASLPLANAGGPYSGTVGQPILFDGSGSYDPDGNITLYEWDFDNDGIFDFSSSSATTTHVYNAPYTGLVMLRVTDNSGNTATSTASVTVEPGSVLACNSAPEGFETGVPPLGWTVVNNVPDGPNWTNIAGCGELRNYTGGTGEAACTHVGTFGEYAWDTELRTPPFSLVDLSEASVTYRANFQSWAGVDYLDLDVSTDGGTTWTNLRHWNDDHGVFQNTPGEYVWTDLAAYAGQPNVMLRWHYYNPLPQAPGWYAQIDDVRLGCTSLPPTAVTLNDMEASGSQAPLSVPMASLPMTAVPAAAGLALAAAAWMRRKR